MSNRVKKASGQLTCHRDSDRAVAVCGECGKPLCDDHERTLTDSLYSSYRSSYVPLVEAVVGLLVVPAAILGVIGGSTLADLERQLFGQAIGLDTGLLLTAILVGLAGLATTWFQGGDSKTSARLLAREPPERSMCEECYQKTSLARFLSIGLLVLGALLAVGGLVLVVQSQSGVLLAISGLGVALYLLRHDLTLFALGPDN